MGDSMAFVDDNTRFLSKAIIENIFDYETKIYDLPVKKCMVLANFSQLALNTILMTTQNSVSYMLFESEPQGCSWGGDRACVLYTHVLYTYLYIYIYIYMFICVYVFYMYVPACVCVCVHLCFVLVCACGCVGVLCACVCQCLCMCGFCACVLVRLLASGFKQSPALGIGHFGMGQK